MGFDEYHYTHMNKIMKAARYNAMTVASQTRAFPEVRIWSKVIQ